MIQSGRVTALYLFDVSESVDLSQLGDLLHVSAVRAKLVPKPATPAYVQYHASDRAVGRACL